MYKPLYWYFGNITFPDQEVEQVIKELERLGEELIKREDAISSYYLKIHSRPDKIWQPKYEEIVEEITDSIGIQKTSKYTWDYWTQLYFPKNRHNAHHHWNGKATLSFVHFIKPTDENSFVFLDNYGNDYVLPEQREGDIVCFPSYIWHRVKPLKSGRRFVVAGNIEILHQDRHYWDLKL